MVGSECFPPLKTPKAFLTISPGFIQKAGQWQQVQLESWKHHNQDLIIKLKGVDDRDAANLLTNCEIVVDSSQLPALEEGDYYWKDLMGCQVVTAEGYDLGKVIDMMETGSNDVLVIKANLKDAFGIKERLVPFLDGQVIKKVDLATRTIEVDWDLVLNHRINGNKWRYGDWLVFIGIVSLFPEMFRAITDYGVTGRAVKRPAEHPKLESSRLHA